MLNEVTKRAAGIPPRAPVKGPFGASGKWLGHSEGSAVLLQVVFWGGWGGVGVSHCDLGISATLLCVQACDLWDSWPLG